MILALCIELELTKPKIGIFYAKAVQKLIFPVISFMCMVVLGKGNYLLLLE
ncbi:MAG: hypothetical protein P8Q16_09375 [Flavobacteriales bacterium]|nr:hypothetical protein [Flavobacteriales bacterium]MDG1440957.1 hypothetical protein [Flavobacteriales bacterium]